MTVKKKRFSALEKLKVAMEAMKGELTIAEISSKYGVHSLLTTERTKSEGE